MPPVTTLSNFVALSAATRVRATWLNAVDGMLAGGWHNPLNFGAVGDNVANDTVSVQATVDSINSLGKAATLFLPPGYTFALTEVTLPVTVQRISMYGATVRHSAVGAGFGLFSKLTAAGLGPFIVEGGTIEGNAGDVLDQADSAFFFRTAASDAGAIGDTEWIIFRDVVFKNMRGFPIRGGWAHNILLDHCTFDNCSIGPNLYTSRALWVVNCEFNGQQYTGTSITPMLSLNTYPEPVNDTADNQMRGVHILGNVFRNITKHQAILLHGATFGEIAGNTFESCNAPISIHDNGVVGSYMAQRYLSIHDNIGNGTDDYGSATVGDLHTHGAAGEVNWNCFVGVSGNPALAALRIRVHNNICAHYGHAAEAGGAGDSLVGGVIQSNGRTAELEVVNNLITDSYGAAVRLIGEQLDFKIQGNTIRDLLNPSGQLAAAFRLLDTTPTGAVMSGDIRDNTLDTMSIGLAATQTTPDFSGVRYHNSNRLIAVTTPFSVGAGTNPPKTPRMRFTATPITIDASVTRYAMIEVDSALTINAPTNPMDGDILEFQVYNPGSLGTITWNAIFHGPTFTNPVGGAFKSRMFMYESSRARWNECGSAAQYT